MPLETGDAEVNGTRLYYEAAGQGETVVLIHGFSLDRRMWAEQFGPLSEHYRVVAYDQRGFGRSALPAGPYNRAADLQALLAYLGGAPAHVVGLSLGGAVAIDFARRQPALVRSLVLADAVLPGFAWSPEHVRMTAPLWAEARAIGLAATKERWLRCGLFDSALRNAAARVPVQRIIADYSGWHFVNNDPAMVEPVAAASLPAFTTPALVVTGEHDLDDFQAIAAVLGRMPNARRVVIPGAGHMVNMEAPAEFNALLAEFLRHGHSAAAAPASPTAGAAAQPG